MTLALYITWLNAFTSSSNQMSYICRRKRHVPRNFITKSLDEDSIMARKARHHGVHDWNVYSGTLPLSEALSIHLKIGHPQISSTGAQSLKELQKGKTHVIHLKIEHA